MEEEKKKQVLNGFENTPSESADQLPFFNSFLVPANTHWGNPSVFMLVHPAYLLLQGDKVEVEMIFSGGGGGGGGHNPTRRGNFLFAGPHQQKGSGNSHGSASVAFVCINNVRVTRRRGNFQKPERRRPRALTRSTVDGVP